MVYLITDSGVESGKTLKELNKKYGIELEACECMQLGPDQVIKVTKANIDFLEDKRRMSNIMFGNFFRKDNSAKLIMLVNLIITTVILFIK